MKKILSYISEHFRKEFNPVFLLLYLIFLFGFVALRYLTGFDYNFWNSSNRYVWGVVFYTAPVFGVSILYAFTHKKAFLTKLGFWFNALFVSFVLFGAHYLTFYVSFLYSQPFEIQNFLRQVLYNSHASLWYLLPALLFWYFFDKSCPESFYGLTHKNFDWKTYALMFAVVVPLIAWASFRQDFLEMYPRYKPSDAEAYLSTSYSATFFTHLFFYLLQFLALEVCFRGFMVFSLSRFMDGGSVWVMVFVYVLIHFGKPWPETVSSAFGGYVLGVLSLKTRSVMGGVYIHGGVALFMEFFAYLQLFIFAQH